MADKGILHPVKIIFQAVHNQTLAIGLPKNSKPTENYAKVVKACYTCSVHYVIY
jgi:hypothetical protein